MAVIAVFAVIAFFSLLIFDKLERRLVPSYIELMTHYLQQFPEEDIQRIGKEVYEINLKQLPSTKIVQLAQLDFVQSFAIGFFVSIILSVILRKQPNP